MTQAAVRFAAADELARQLAGRADAVAPAGPLRVDPIDGPALPRAALFSPPRPPLRPVYDRPVPLVSGARRLAAWSAEPPGTTAPEDTTQEDTTQEDTRPPAPRYRVAVDGVGCFSLSSDGREVRQVALAAAAERAPAEVALEVALGPVLVLALALQGTFCLHASAAEVAGGALVFAGDSGSGKSTLAAHCAAARGWQRLTDDITPLAWERSDRSGRPTVRPRFPQLKLAAAAAAPLPESVGLHRICLLATGDEVEVEPVPAQRAVGALVRHTVAARLFDRGLLASHLERVSALAGGRVWELRYPRERAALANVRTLLRAWIHTDG